MSTREKALSRHRQLRQELLEAYGHRCECCGETRQTFLTLDHKNNDGSKHRISLRKNKKSNYKESRNSTNFWYDLKKRGWPKDHYRLACYNCNVGRHRNSDMPGVCPHEIERGEIVSVELKTIIAEEVSKQLDWLDNCKPVGAS